MEAVSLMNKTLPASTTAGEAKPEVHNSKHCADVRNRRPHMSALRNVLARLLPTRYKDYELVASDSIPFRSWTQHYRHSRHVFRRVFTLRNISLAVPASLILLVSAILINGGVPALYGDVREFERHLPQHNASMSEVEGVKYLAFPGHIWGHGWNNILQE